MAHPTYQTEGIVLGGINTKEADRYLDIFTRDFGLVRATAKSVREEKSKLRYSLQQFSHSDISLVRGREVWRVTGASIQENFYSIKHSREVRILLMRVAALMRRLLTGEEKNEDLFDATLEGFSFLTTTTLNKDEVTAVERILVLRVLYLLGYVSQEGAAGTYLGTTFDPDTITTAIPDEKNLTALINQALRETQL